MSFIKNKNHDAQKKVMLVLCLSELHPRQVFIVHVYKHIYVHWFPYHNPYMYMYVCEIYIFSSCQLNSLLIYQVTLEIPLL